MKTTGKEPAGLESELNSLGRERWECVTVSAGSGDASALLVLKRPMKSYLGDLSLRDLMRILPERN